MNIADIQLLYEYNYWANKRIFEVTRGLTAEQFLAPVAQAFGSVRSTLVHILDTEWGWRILCQRGTLTETINADEFPTVQLLIERWDQEERTMREYLVQLNDSSLSDLVRYTLENGTKRERVLWHCLIHVVNHGTHHRSQAAAILKEHGQSPGELDFTVFLNSRVQ